MVHVSRVGGSQRTQRKPSHFMENMQTPYRKDSMGPPESNPPPSSYEATMLIPCTTPNKDLHPPTPNQKKARTLPMEHLDVSSFKLIWVAAVNDDDPLHQGAEATSQRRHHLGNKTFSQCFFF